MGSDYHRDSGRVCLRSEGNSSPAAQLAQSGTPRKKKKAAKKSALPGHVPTSLSGLGTQLAESEVKGAAKKQVKKGATKAATKAAVGSLEAAAEQALGGKA